MKKINLIICLAIFSFSFTLAQSQDELTAEGQPQAEEERQRLLPEQTSRAQARFVRLWRDRILSGWRRPPNTPSGLSAFVRVRVDTNGQIRDISIVQSSGNARFDQSVQQTIRRVSPFPVPDDASTFRQSGLEDIQFRFVDWEKHQRQQAEVERQQQAEEERQRQADEERQRQAEAERQRQAEEERQRQEEAERQRRILSRAPWAQRSMTTLSRIVGTEAFNAARIETATETLIGLRHDLPGFREVILLRSVIVWKSGHSE